MMLMALDLIIMHQRMTIKGGGSVRRIVEISEIAGLEKNRPRLNTIFKWDPASNTLKETGVPSKLREKISRAANISLKEFDELLRERQEIFDGLVIKNYRDAKTVTKVIQNYYLKKAEEPEKEEEIGDEEEEKRTIFGKKKIIKT